jgi:hypothetical protein
MADKSELQSRLTGLQMPPSIVVHSLDHADSMCSSCRYPASCRRMDTGTPLGPHDFKGGLKTICFRVLRENGFEIIVKADHLPFPEEIDPEETYAEVYQARKDSGLDD